MLLKGTKTEKNLWAAFAGESQTRNKYTYFSEVALKEGHKETAGVFEEIANQEKDHAKTIFEFLKGIKDTTSNLKLSAVSENYEGATMYKEFERVAREEGFEEIALFFGEVAAIELEHEKTLSALLTKILEEKK
ncbi:rubrerythrin [Clostridium aceticum]|uniref:Rubrerythrin n=1 Tax=Clostridium aceticum TaxID=84022 RepID=A0A0G3W807_9CLOT|nr:rubrerythrin family protein [Clostridium aceticum]AKL93970.1 rubrerythrin [Clostridium aceticum]